MKPENNRRVFTASKRRNIFHLLGKTARDRGRWTEERFFNAIKNANGSAPDWYKDITKTKRKMDRKGIDFIIYTDKNYGYGENVYIQIKSSDFGANKFLEQSKTKRAKYKIIVLVIKIGYGEEEIRNLTFPAIQAEIDSYKKPFC